MTEDKNIHVLHVLNSAYGGSSVSTYQLIESLKAYNIKSSLVCFDNARQHEKDRISQMVDGRVLFIPLYWANKRTRVKWWKRPLLECYMMLRTWKGYRFQDRIGSMIRRHGINIVHTSTLVNPEGAIAARRNRIPHVWHVRELIGPGTYYEFPQHERWVSRVTRDATVLVANSKATGQNLLKYFTSAKIIHIPNGIDPARFKLTHHQRRVDPTVVGMVGNVTSRLKNHEFFIRTAAEFPRQSKVEFHIYGSLPGPEDDYLKNLKTIIVEQGLEHRVLFKGHVEKPETIMEQVDILFHPTGLESFGRIFIEAMAAGIPIVAVNNGGAKELVLPEFNGYVVDENDTRSACTFIEKLSESAGLREKLGKNGRALVERQYNLDSMTKQFVDLYQSLVNHED